MKTWKIITVTIIALVAAALLTATAFAYMGGRGFYSPYGTNTATGSYGAYPSGMMGGGHMGGGMMGGYGYGTTTPPTSSGQYGMGRCRGWNGYASPTAPTQGVAITLDKAVDVAKTYLEIGRA